MAIDWKSSQPEEAKAVKPKVSAELIELETLVHSFIEAQARKVQASQDVEALTERIKAHFPNGIGDYAKKAGKFTVSLKRGDKYVWDSAKLEGLFVAKTIPDYVKRRLTIDKRTYTKLDADEQNRLSEALTVEPGTVKIEIVEECA